MKKIIGKTIIKKLVFCCIIVVLVIIAVIVFLEITYQKGIQQIEEGNYFYGVKYLKRIKYYRDCSSLLGDNKVKLMYSIESLDCSNIEAKNIDLIDFVNLDATRLCYILENLNIPFDIKYIESKENECNGIVSVNINSENKIELFVNDYYGSSKENVNYILGLSIHVTERGKYIYFASEGSIYRSKADLKDTEEIYKSEGMVTQIASKGDSVYFVESIEYKKSLKKLNTKTNEIEDIISDGMVTFVIQGNKIILIMQNENGDKECWINNIDLPEQLYLIDTNSFSFKYYNNEIGYFYENNDKIKFYNLISQSSEKIDTLKNVEIFDASNNIIVYKIGILDREINHYKTIQEDNFFSYEIKDLIGITVSSDRLFAVQKTENNSKFIILYLKNGKVKEQNIKLNFKGNICEVGGYIFSNSISGIYDCYYNLYLNEFCNFDIGYSDSGETKVIGG